METETLHEEEIEKTGYGRLSHSWERERERGNDILEILCSEYLNPGMRTNEKKALGGVWRPDSSRLDPELLVSWKDACLLVWIEPSRLDDAQSSLDRIVSNSMKPYIHRLIRRRIRNHSCSCSPPPSQLP